MKSMIKPKRLLIQLVAGLFLISISFPTFYAEGINNLNSATPALQTPQELPNAEMVISESIRPPNSNAAWKTVTLPYTVRDVPIAEQPKRVWFRFKTEVPDEYFGIYLSRYRNKARVYINQQYIGGDEEPAGSFVTAWNYPLLLGLKTTAFKSNGNYIYINLIGGDYGPLIAAPVIGPYSKLHKQWEERTFWQATTSLWSFILCIVLAIVTFWFWLLQRDDKLYLKFAGASLSAAIVMSYLFVREYPIQLAPLLVIVHTAIDFLFFFMFAFISQALNINSDRSQKTLLSICIMAGILYIFVPREYFFYSAYTIHAVNLNFLLYIFIRASISTVIDFKISLAWIPIAFLGIILLSAHDIYYFVLSDEESRMKASNMAQFVVPFLLLCLFAHLGQRFINALRNVETHERELETRVRQKGEELEQIFSQTLVLERQQSALEEREKIYRDLHDDVGSKLISIIQSPDVKKSPSLARAALENLRTAIFRAKYPNLTLATLLKDCEEETKLRADSVGIQVFWTLEADLLDIQLSSTTNYHLIRIFRETITNCFQQSNCQYISISVTQSNSELTFQLSNPCDSPEFVISKYGNGLGNVRFRAAEINAHAQWSKDGNEMVFSLQLPLKPLEVEKI